eukprot:TRINITY_DN3746_c1_g1_i2.p1 TRINITY_DN3746_c1_g1~~TRINITY_DN3746_c1_g1_i2.p1  ORF type:complete len:669 (+),score=172.77 TRINITY_DN3746_c1_g1_i2:227-2008(+)
MVFNHPDSVVWHQLPKESHKVFFELISPKTSQLPHHWVSSSKAQEIMKRVNSRNKDSVNSNVSNNGSGLGPAVVILPGTGESGYTRRRASLALPLSEKGITSIILEGPFYGKRRPPKLHGSKLKTVSDLPLLGRATIIEATAVLEWLKKQGYWPLVVMGVSMGGLHSAMTASVTGFPVGAVSWLGPPSAAPVFTEGLLSTNCDWRALSCDLGMELEQLLQDAEDISPSCPFDEYSLKDLMLPSQAREDVLDVLDSDDKFLAKTPWEALQKVRSKVHVTKVTQEAKQRRKQSLIDLAKFATANTKQWMSSIHLLPATWIDVDHDDIIDHYAPPKRPHFVSAPETIPRPNHSIAPPLPSEDLSAITCIADEKAPCTCRSPEKALSDKKLNRLEKEEMCWTSLSHNNHSSSDSTTSSDSEYEYEDELDIVIENQTILQNMALNNKQLRKCDRLRAKLNMWRFLWHTNISTFPKPLASKASTFVVGTEDQYIPWELPVVQEEWKKLRESWKDCRFVEKPVGHVSGILFDKEGKCDEVMRVFQTLREIAPTNCESNNFEEFSKIGLETDLLKEIISIDNSMKSQRQSKLDTTVQDMRE